MKHLLIIGTLALLAGCQAPGSKAPTAPPGSPPIAPPGVNLPQGTSAPSTSPGIPAPPPR